MIGGYRLQKNAGDGRTRSGKLCVHLINLSNLDLDMSSEREKAGRHSERKRWWKLGGKLRVSHVLLILVTAYVILKAFQGGNDINVYLYASKQFFRGENIYAENPFNEYLYSPLFALLLGPISIFKYPVARMIWGMLNLLVAIRLWKIIGSLITQSINMERKYETWWSIGVAVISIGYLNHNIILGQITVVILWLTFEGIYQILHRNKTVLGAVLLALGINIKIIPLAGLYYLFFKARYKAVAICTGMVIIGLFLPSIVVGFNQNTTLLQNWFEKINPTGDSYVFENNDGTQSLNAVLPAFFYDFNDGKVGPANLKRQLLSVPYDVLVTIMHAIRILLLLSLLYLIFYRYKRREKGSIYLLWEFAYLAVISVLVFPHQQKYTLLYFVPAGSYMILFVLMVFKQKWDVGPGSKIIAILSSILMLIMALNGRDIIGHMAVRVLDYYHTTSIFIMIFLVLLILTRPDLLIRMSRKKSIED